MAIVRGSAFLDGIIEFDIAFTGERGFMGACWRLQDPENYEEFYLRPHQSGNPDANQYQPVFHGIDAWQLYTGEGYCAPTQYVFNAWMHVKVVVSGSRAEVYIRDMEEPAVVVGALQRNPRTGAVGLTAGNFAPAAFSRFSFTPVSSPTLKGTPAAARKARDGTVMHWLVSGLFPESTLTAHLPKGAERRFSWSSLRSEETGIANLARIQGTGRDSNTVFARVVLRSDHSQTVRMEFGFSDAVRIYLNGTALYGGNDMYRSRDYRFLGTIGWFDEVYLPLKKGDNEVWMAVSENFGGWGVQARIGPAGGLLIRE